MSLNKPNVTQPQLDQPGSQFVLNTAGASLALGPTAKGSDSIAESQILSYNGAVNGGILGANTEALGESVTQLTVV